MVIIGYNNNHKKISQWAVENTWGVRSGNKGFITMSTEWLEEYSYLFVIHKDVFTQNQINKYNQGLSDIVNIQPWDILACGALTLN